MKEQLIEFETAKLAKEKGFKAPTNKAYNEKGTLISDYKENLPIAYSIDFNIKYSNAPTQSLLQKWLREVHGIHILIDWEGSIPDDVSKHKWVWYQGRCNIDNPETDNCSDGFNTYEEALEKGLYEALKLIK